MATKQSRSWRLQSTLWGVFSLVALGLVFNIDYTENYPDPNEGFFFHPSTKNQNNNKFLLVSMCTESPISQTSFQDKQAYCDRHSQIDCLLRAHLSDSRFSPKWEKYPAMQDGLQRGNYTWAIWVDCDTLFMNPSRSIVNEFPFQEIDENIDVLFTTDHEGINLGVFAIRNSLRGHQFLDDMYSQRILIEYFGTNMKDQNALKFLKKNDKIGLKEYSIESSGWSQIMNSFCPYGPIGGILYHMAGCKTEECLDFFQCYHDRLRDADEIQCRVPQKVRSTCKRQKAYFQSRFNFWNLLDKLKFIDTVKLIHLK